MSKLLSAILCFLAVTCGAQDYFQQHVAYTINVKLDDNAHMLRADMDVVYTNNSPDELSELWFHIWPNAYSSKSSALNKQKLSVGDFDLYYATDEEKGYIDSLDFYVDNFKVDWEVSEEHPDIVRIQLKSPLKPGGSITVSTPFKVKLPDGKFSRLGHVGQSYQITQWYPKPAVYDREGWHLIPYLDQGEFYSEFGSYDVTIELPRNYVVGATGDLQNDEEMEWLNGKAATTADRIEKNNLVRDRKTQGLKFPDSDPLVKKLNYTQDNVHDFAWFADKRYHVLKGEVQLPHSGRTVTTWTMFTNSEVYLWQRSIEYMDSSVYYYSLWNGDYPYNQATAVDGTISAGGGMEYPNVTVIGHSGSAVGLETVIMHEVGHNWFYGILGSNERAHAWMDEGLNTLNENRYLETRYPDRMLRQNIGINSNIAKKFGLDIFKNKSLYELSFLLNARRNYDQPIDLPADEYTSINYGGIVYSKTGIVFDYLLAYLGQELFDECMQTYFDRWKFKHPQPADLKAVFEEVTGKDMSWFFDDLIPTTKQLDHKIMSAKKEEWGDYTVRIKQKGEINGPFALGGIKDDSTRVYQWYDSIPESGEVTFPGGDYTKIMLDPYWDTPELTRSNNSLKVKGLMKRAEPLRIQALGGIENPYRSTLYWMPLYGWNKNDGSMTGLAFYNSVFPRKKVEFALAPMYAWNSKEVVGMGNLAYNFNTKHNSVLQNLRIDLVGQRFSESRSDLNAPYLVGKARIDAELRRKRLKFSAEQHIVAEYTFVDSDLDLDDDDHFADLGYWVEFDRPFYHVVGKANVNYAMGSADRSMLGMSFEATNSFRYTSRGHWISLRSYAAFIPHKSDAGLEPGWGNTLSGANGIYDYKYDQLFLGRNINRYDMLSQQFARTQGGFRMFAPIVSDTWLSTFSLDVELPIPLGISLFSDFGFYPSYNVASGTYTTETAYDFGATLNMFGGNLKIHFPFAYSSLFKDFYEINDYQYMQRVRFELKLNEMNPLKLISRIDA